MPRIVLKVYKTTYFVIILTVHKQRKKIEGCLVSSFREKKGEVSITGYVEQMELEKNKFQLCFNISPNTYHKGSRGFWSFEVFLELQSVLKTWLFLWVNTVISA